MRKKITYCLLFLLLLISPFGIYAQNQKMKFSESRVTLKTAFEQIEKQTGLSVAYDSKIIDTKKSTSSIPKEVTLNDLMALLLDGTNCTYTITKSRIIISQSINNNSEKLRSSSISSKTYSGIVVDAEGLPIIGASISVKGERLATMSDIDGTFTIDTSEKATLLITYIGYHPQEIRLTEKTILTIRLVEDTKTLDELVVVGYGTVKKSNLTGAISSIKMDEVPKAATVSVSNLLTGRVPGLVIRQTSASPEGGYNMLIRGAASTGAGNVPLYVIDGFPGGDINSVNPEDIESVEVLKDASSTAIYGARAANGVIIVNTKRGTKGTLNISFKSNLSLQTISNPYELVGAKEYMQMANDFFVEEWMYNNKIAPYGSVDPSSITSKPKQAFSTDQIANASDVTDWFKEVTRTGIINNESLSISGGEDRVRYLLSFSHFGQKGVVVNSGFEKFNGRVSLDIDLAKWLTTGISVSGNQAEYDLLVTADNGDQHGVLKSALMYPNYLSVYDDEGKYLINPDHAMIANPVSWKDVTNKSKNNLYLINNFWNINFSKELAFRFSWGTNQAFNRKWQYYPKSHLEGQAQNSYGNITEGRRNNYLMDATLTYSKKVFDNHNLKLMGGYAYQTFNYEEVSASNSDFISDIFNVHNLGAGGDDTKKLGSSKSKTKYLSYFGRINYDIADKYLFTFTMRADGSDKFGKDNRFGYFPSGAFAWRISEEKFMKEQDILSNLKLRASLGQTGNAEIGENAFGFYTVGLNSIFGNDVALGVSETQLSNPKLKWETTTEYNVGLDFGFLKNRVSGTFEFFQKTISDLLDKRNVGSYYPVSSVMDNLGSTQSNGVELQITTVNIHNKNIKWSTDLNLAQYRDSWKERNPETILSVYQTETDPLHVIWGYQTEGLIQEGDVIPHMPDAIPGSMKIKDLNGWLKDGNGDFILDAQGRKLRSGKPDGVIDDADKVIICREAPDLNFGIGNNLSWKNFDLSVFFYGEIGRQMYNRTRPGLVHADRFRYSDNVLVDARDRWSHSNPNGKYPSNLFQKYDGSNDFWVEDADFLRLKSITLGYTIPNKIFKGAVKNARVYVDAQNLFVLTNYTGSDPETDRYSAYPNQKTFSFGIELNF